MEVIVGGIYKHYKTGGLYRVVEIVKHTETEELMVFYKCLQTGTAWVRPYNMFIETVMLDGKSTPRFIFLGDGTDIRNNVNENYEPLGSATLTDSDITNLKSCTDKFIPVKILLHQGKSVKEISEILNISENDIVAYNLI